MRLEIDEMAEIISDYFASVIPAKLITKGLKTIESFNTAPANDPELRQLSVYVSDCYDDESQRDDGFIVQAFLPGEDAVHAWHSVLFPVVREFDCKLVGHVTKSVSTVGFFPGESDEGGGASIIYFEMKFSSKIDSCD